MNLSSNILSILFNENSHQIYNNELKNPIVQTFSGGIGSDFCTVGFWLMPTAVADVVCALLEGPTMVELNNINNDNHDFHRKIEL